MVSGPTDAIEKARAALEAIGRVFVVGDQVGLGQVLKLVNNGLAATSVIASAEAIVMAVQAGLDARTAVEVINASSGRNFMTERSEEHTSELQSLMSISYAVFCLNKKKTTAQKKRHKTNT